MTYVTIRLAVFKSNISSNENGIVARASDSDPFETNRSCIALSSSAHAYRFLRIPLVQWLKEENLQTWFKDESVQYTGATQEWTL